MMNHLEPLERRTLLAGTISGVVFDDLNGNGVREAGEPGLASQRVFIDKNFNGQRDFGESSVLTNASGAYVFTGLPNGIVRLRHELSTGRRLTAPGAIFHDVPVTFNTNVTGRNFGSTNTAVIRGSVFRDLDGDGVRDPGEPGLAGWTVWLDKNQNGKIDTREKIRVTNSNGDYRFTGLTPGTYFVRVVQKTGFARTSPPTGIYTVKVASGQGFSNRNFGEETI